MRKAFGTIIAAAGLLALAGTAQAQGRGDESPGQNVRESHEYEQLLCTNPGFRARRIAQECGPLQGSQFYDNCVASFQCGAVHRHSNRPPPSETIR